MSTVRFIVCLMRILQVSKIIKSVSNDALLLKRLKDIKINIVHGTKTRTIGVYILHRHNKLLAVKQLRLLHAIPLVYRIINNRI